MTGKIAWIEDDIDIIEPVIRPLKRAGYEFLELGSVKDVLDNLDDVRTCDLILLDMILPTGAVEGTFGRYPGLKLLKMFREELSIDIPSVVLTVVTNEDTITELKDFGALDIILKPVLPSELRERVLKALKSAQG